MSRRRGALNPSKVKTDTATLKKHPPPEVFKGRLDIRRRLSVCLLCLFSAVLLMICFAPFDKWYLAYVALVPWGLAVVGGHKGFWAILWCYLAGVFFWAAGIYWLTWITIVGYVPLVLYLGVYWLAAGLLLRRAFRRGWPMWVTLPVVWVAFEYARAFALSGFPWFFLGHSQYAQTRLIQITDVTGQYGVSFFVAMVNGAIIDALAQPLFVRTGRGGRLTTRIGLAAAVCVISAVGLLVYGTWRVNQDTTRPGPRVGVVQEAFPISLFEPDAPPQEIFDAHIDNSHLLAEAGCDLVVWPESMLGFHDMTPSRWLSLDASATDPLDPSRPAYTPEQQHLILTYQRNLRRLGRLAADLDCPLLVGGSMPASLRGQAEGLMCNSALLFDRDGAGRLRLRTQYAKMHLVPFGEYVPFREGWPALHKWLREFVPTAMPQLEPGKAVATFEVDFDGQVIRFAVPICYEGSFARVCRRMAMRGRSKRIDMLVNISNDGWFVYSSAGRTHASTELAQHLTQYVFRAIETRVPVVRAVNTGISAHVDSNGRIRGVVSRGGRREMAAGNLTAQVLVDRRVSVYSLVGDVFVWAVCLAAGAGVAALFLPRRGAKE